MMNQTWVEGIDLPGYLYGGCHGKNLSGYEPDRRDRRPAVQPRKEEETGVDFLVLHAAPMKVVHVGGNGPILLPRWQARSTKSNSLSSPFRLTVELSSDEPRRRRLRLRLCRRLGLVCCLGRSTNHAVSLSTRSILSVCLSSGSVFAVSAVRRATPGSVPRRCLRLERESPKLQSFWIKARPSSNVAPPSKPKRVVDAQQPVASTGSPDISVGVLNYVLILQLYNDVIFHISLSSRKRTRKCAGLAFSF
ncbi:hypothetical protein NL676_010198 [Syzygium grande]|nr:hypothetical protein NL676_010198 [Syzygium grande]